MQRPRLAGFPIVITVPVAWGEMDAFGHVNNIVYFRYFESARIAYLDAIGFRGDAAIGPILASTQCRFRLPLAYPDTVQIGARTVDVAADRFTMEYRIVSERKDAVAADGGGIIVAYDYVNTTKATLPDEVTARIRHIEAGVEREVEAQ